MSKQVLFVDRTGDGEGPWEVSVDGVVVIDELHADDMDVSASAMTPLWEAIGVEVRFEWSGSNTGEQR